MDGNYLPQTVGRRYHKRVRELVLLPQRGKWFGKILRGINVEHGGEVDTAAIWVWTPNACGGPNAENVYNRGHHSVVSPYEDQHPP